eukprot:5184028-Amphidinium_carterae.1
MTPARQQLEQLAAMHAAAFSHVQLPALAASGHKGAGYRVAAKDDHQPSTLPSKTWQSNDAAADADAAAADDSSTAGASFGSSIAVSTLLLFHSKFSHGLGPTSCNQDALAM